MMPRSAPVPRPFALDLVIAVLLSGMSAVSAEGGRPVELRERVTTLARSHPAAERLPSPLSPTYAPEIPFSQGLPIAVPGWPADIETADFDGDGRVDVATAHPDSNRIAVWSSATRELLGETVTTAPLRLVSGEFVGTPPLDLAVLSGGSPGIVTVFRGLGDGGFELETSFPIGSFPTDMESADLDDDGRLDLVISTRGDSSVYVVPGIPQGFGTPRRTPGITHPSAVAIADENGDASPDVQVALYADSAIRLLRNAGDGTWASERDVRCGFLPVDVRLADVDGDGALDLATVHEGPRAEVRRGDGSGDFGPRLIESLLGTSFYGVPVMECADLDGSGGVELLVAHGGSGNAAWLWVFSVTPVGLVEEVRYYVGPGIFGGAPVAIATALGVADLDADGGRDVLVGRRTGHEKEVLGLRQRKGLAYAGQQEYDLPAVVPGAVAVDAVDFELRGRDDLLVSRGGRTWLVRFRDEGTVASMIELAPGLHDLVLDLNGDGRLDLIKSAGDSTRITLIEPGGALGPTAHLQEGPLLSLGDFDGDGDPDLAVRAMDGRLRTCTNDGNGVFAGCASHDPLPFAAFDADAGDIDADGMDDLAVATFQDSVVLYRGLASGSFERWTALHFQRLEPYDTPRQVLVRDMDDNDRADVILLMASPTEPGQVHVRLSLANSTFQPLPAAPVVREEAWLFPLDVDSDGDLDVASTMHSGTGEGRLQYLLNDGGGVLTNPKTSDFGVHPLDHYPSRLAFGHFDADAAPDLAVGYYGSIAAWGQGFGVMLNDPGVPTAIDVSLVQAAALADRVRIEWLVISDEFVVLEVWRAVGAEENEPVRLAEVLADGQGHVRYDDLEVQDGERHVYRLRNAVTGAWLGTPVEVVWHAVPGFGLDRPHPNPSIGAPAVRFRLVAGEPATLSLLDVAGRRVRRLSIPASAGGPGVAHFPRGIELEPGLYWIRLEQGARRAIGRVVVVR